MKIKYDDYLDSDMPRKDIFEAGAASRQGEVDLLEKEIVETQEFLNKQNCIKQAKIDELQKRIDEALNVLDSLQEQHWKKWKEGADMMDQGASNAYEHSYWILKGQNNG